VITGHDFVPAAEGGLYLGQEGKRRYFAEYAQELSAPFAYQGGTITFRQVFRQQAERLAAHLTRGEPYESFRLPC
jgi:hypothetical protein